MKKLNKQAKGFILASVVCGANCTQPDDVI